MTESKDTTEVMNTSGDPTLVSIKIIITKLNQCFLKKWFTINLRQAKFKMSPFYVLPEDKEILKYYWGSQGSMAMHKLSCTGRALIHFICIFDIRLKNL